MNEKTNMHVMVINYHRVTINCPNEAVCVCVCVCVRVCVCVFDTFYYAYGQGTTK